MVFSSKEETSLSQVFMLPNLRHLICSISLPTFFIQGKKKMPVDIRLPNSGFYALYICIICTYIHKYSYRYLYTHKKKKNQALMQSKRKPTLSQSVQTELIIHVCTHVYAYVYMLVNLQIAEL